MTTSPTKGGWWDKFKEAVLSLPELEPGETEIDELRSHNAKLQAANEDLRQQLSNAKTNERKLSWRIEAFRKKWPAIHKDFFTAKGKNNEL